MAALVPGMPHMLAADQAPGPRRAWWRAGRARSSTSAPPERGACDIGELWRNCSIVRDEMAGLLQRVGGRVRIAAFTNDMTVGYQTAAWSRAPPLAECALRCRRPLTAAAAGRAAPRR